MSRSEPLGAVVVGAGLMGRWHAHALTRAAGQVHAIVDRDLDRARALASRYPGAEANSDLQSVLETGTSEVVHVCTPLETHDTLTRTALASRRHVLVEKPLAPSAAIAAELLQLARERGVLLCPVHQFLFQPGMLRLQAALPRLGRVLHLDYVACSAGAEGQEGAGRDAVALDILPHPLSLVQRLLPEPLAALSWQLQHPAPGELRVSGTAGGRSVGILVSMAGRPTRNTLRIVCEAGTTHVDLFHGFCVIESGTVSRTRKLARPFLLTAATLGRATVNLAARAARGETAYPGLRELVRRFYAAIRGDGSPPVSPAETLAVAATHDALRTLLRSLPAPDTHEISLAR